MVQIRFGLLCLCRCTSDQGEDHGSLHRGAAEGERPRRVPALREAVTPLVDRFGGRFRVRGGELDVVEGDWAWPRLVIIEFQSKDAARLFYKSPEYQKILSLRQASSQGTVAIVEGV